MPEGQATLHLHIGRNKAGSTTLQSYFVEHAEVLLGKGVQYVLFGQPSPPGRALPSFPTHRHIASHVRSRPGGAVLVSHEGLCCFPLELTRIMASDLADLDLQVIFYIRPYGEWVVSSYGFDVRVGFNGRDFDRYLADIWPTISCWPTLQIWGDTIGWERLRVRSLDPRDLQDGNLVSDCLAAIGVSAPAQSPATRENMSLNWMVIEMLRMVVGRDTAPGWDRVGLSIAQVLHEVLDASLTACNVPRTPGVYMTRQSACALAGQYKQDLALIAAHTGASLQYDEPGQYPERRSLPSVDQIPVAVLRMVRDRVLATATAREHPETAAFVSSAAFSQLCVGHSPLD